METFVIHLNKSTANHVKSNAKANNEPAGNYISRVLNSQIRGDSTPQQTLITQFLGESDTETTYSPAEFFHSQILGEHGSKRNVSVRLPEWLADEILTLVNNDKYPYTNVSDFLADAVFHRLQQNRLYSLDAKSAELVKQMTTYLRVLQQQETAASYRKVIARAIEDYEIAKASYRDIGSEAVRLQLQESIQQLNSILDGMTTVNPSVKHQARRERDRLVEELEGM